MYVVHDSKLELRKLHIRSSMNLTGVRLPAELLDIQGEQNNYNFVNSSKR